MPSPPAMEDTEVSSQRPSPGRGGADKTVQKAPEDNTSDAVERGTATPMTTEGGGPQQFGPSPNTVPETNAALGSDQHPPSTEGGGAAAPSAASANLEAAHTLEEALQRASIMEEHRTLMGAVMEKVRSAKSGLTEAFNSLLTGFEVCDVILLQVFLYARLNPCIDSSP